MAIVKIKNCMNCKIGHEWIFDGPSLKELRTIKTLTGLNGVSFGDAAAESDPEALAALLYVLHKRDKITIPFEDIDLDFSDFEMDETEEERAEREAAEASAKGKAPRPKTRNGAAPKAG